MTAAIPFNDAHVIAVFQRLLSPDSIRRHDKTGGWLQRYCGHLASRTAGERHLRAIENCLQLGHQSRLRGLRILEVGSGFGLTCATLAMKGAESVDCVDFNEPMVNTMRSYLTDLPAALPVRPHVGPAWQLPYPENHFDVVFSVEAQSHFLNLERCQMEAHRVLKPGGRYIIADDNNALNAQVIQVNREVWARFENGPATEDIHGHSVREPYRNRRSRMLRESFPQLSLAQADELARRTAYFCRPELLKAGEQYLTHGIMPDSVYQTDRCPVEPETGQYIENLINPVTLAHQLEAIGFDVKLEAYFGGESRGGVVYQGNRLLNALVPSSLLLRRSQGFRVRAVKRT